jgi:hypothetical protein
MTDLGTTPRRALTTLQKLQVLVRYSRCPMCGEQFGKLDEIDFDHVGQLALTEDNGLDNFRPLHRDGCHKAKSAADARDRAKVRRNAKANAEFNARMATREPGEPRKKSGRIPSRGFPKMERTTG